MFGKNEGEVKTFQDKQNPREFIDSRLVLQEMPKGICQAKMETQ